MATITYQNKTVLRRPQNIFTEHFLKMYKRDKTLILPTTASAISNNLAVNKCEDNDVADSIAVIHHGCINVVSVNESGSPKSKYIPLCDASQQQNANVTQVMWCTLGSSSVLVVTSNLGLQIFDCDLLECCFAHPCQDTSPSADCFARGLATICDAFLCVGNSAGSVRVFGVLNDEDEIVFVDRKQEHSEAITDLAGNRNMLVSADEGGAVVIWNLTAEELVKLTELPDYKSACTSLHLWNNMIITAYGSGHIRLFSTSTSSDPQLLVEVAAHARWITALDVAMDEGTVLSVSEDSFVKVWDIIETNTTIMALRYYAQIKDSFLVGGKFLTNTGKAFCISAYDSSLVHCFRI